MMAEEAVAQRDHSPPTDERVVGDEDHGRKLLMFHGIILRSQLIELIKNKVFFDENVRVSEQMNYG